MSRSYLKMLMLSAGALTMVGCIGGATSPFLSSLVNGLVSVTSSTVISALLAQILGQAA